MKVFYVAILVSTLAVSSLTTLAKDPLPQGWSKPEALGPTTT